MQAIITPAQFKNIEAAWRICGGGRHACRISGTQAQAWEACFAQVLGFTPPGEFRPVPAPASFVDLTEDVRAVFPDALARRAAIYTEPPMCERTETPSAVFFDPDTSTMHACGIRTATVRVPEGLTAAHMVAVIEPAAAETCASGVRRYVITSSAFAIVLTEAYAASWAYYPPLDLGGMGALHLALCEEAQARLLDAGEDDLGQVAGDLAERLQEMADEARVTLAADV